MAFNRLFAALGPDFRIWPSLRRTILPSLLFCVASTAAAAQLEHSMPMPADKGQAIAGSQSMSRDLKSIVAVDGAWDVPVPLDVSPPLPVTHLWLGSQPIDSGTFLSKLSAEPLLDYYRHALPQTGWTLQDLPWQAYQSAVIAGLEQQLKLYPGQPGEDAVKAHLQQLRATPDMSNDLLYAVKGSARIIVNLKPMQNGMTVGFINRWTSTLSTAEWDPWLMRGNVVCGVDGVPDKVIRSIAVSQDLPMPEGSRAVSVSQLASDTDDVMLMIELPMRVGQASAFYRARMRGLGWTLAESQTADGQELLGYRKDEGKLRCILSLRELGSDGKTMAMVSFLHRPDTLDKPDAPPHS